MIKTKDFRKIIEPAFEKSEQFGAMPDRVLDSHINDLFAEGLIISGRREFPELLKQMRSAVQNGTIVELPRDYAVDIEESNKLIKELSSKNIINLNSTPVLREAIKNLKLENPELEKILNEDVQKNPRWSAWLAQTSGLYPCFLIKDGIAVHKTRAGQIMPPIGYMWVGFDNHVRATSWIRCIEGAQLFAKSQNYRELITLDKEIYANTIKAVVKGKEKDHEVQLTGLPIFRLNDKGQYSEWANLAGYCTCHDVSYRGRAHQNRKNDTYLFCKHQIGVFYKTMARISRTGEKGEGRNIRTNPFVIPAETVMNFIDFLTNNTFVTGKHPLNKTEINQMIGAYLLQKQFDNAFFTWQRRNIDYLKK